MNGQSKILTRFLQMESASGILLVIAALFAMLMANSPLVSIYDLLLDIPVAIQIGQLTIAKPLLLWVNDGLMAVFFLLVGLELKRELHEGELASFKKIVLPALGAIGGMAIPALIYVLANRHNPLALSGWAIPTATDIAFTLGVLSLLGSRVPNSLKIFLTSLAIFDDIGAIIVIALFYTSKLSMTALLIAATCIAVLFLLNRNRVLNMSAYLFIGIVMWISLLKSGVHATLAGIILAMFIPIRVSTPNGKPPLVQLEQELHTPVAFMILPLFAFCNAGLTFTDIGLTNLVHSVSLGIASGLFIGKQLGVFTFCWLGIKLKLAEKPVDISWSALYGTAVLCGIGFTMSLFIGTLAFQQTGFSQIVDERLGIIIGSIASGITGFLILNQCLPRKS